MAAAVTKNPELDAMSTWDLVEIHQTEVLQGGAQVKSPASIVSPPFLGVFYSDRLQTLGLKLRRSVFLIPREADSRGV